MSDAEVKDLNQISKKDIYYTPSGKYIQFIHDHSEKHLMRGNSYRTEVIGCSRARALLLRHLMNLKKKYFDQVIQYDIGFSGCCPGNLTLTESMLHLPAESMRY